MSVDDSRLTSGTDTTPTSTRNMVLAITMTMSVLLYLDRFAVSIIQEAIRQDLRMSHAQIAQMVSAFFWSYALCQVPAGWLSDRFGARLMLTIYILSWSAFTGLMGVAHAVWALLWMRLLCGIAQAGAYPTAVGLIRLWFPVSQCGTASAIVGLGGRIGGALAPVLTGWIVVSIATAQPLRKLDRIDVLDDVAFLSKFDVTHFVETKDDVVNKRQSLVREFISSLSPNERDRIEADARAAVEIQQKREQAKEAKSKARINWSELLADSVNSIILNWLPHNERAQVEIDAESINTLIPLLSDRLAKPDFVDIRQMHFKLSSVGQRLLNQRNTGGSLSSDDNYRLNRMFLEKLFPNELLRYEGRGWRRTLIVYGWLGVGVAIVFWFAIRNSPKEHPRCNQAEIDFVGLAQRPQSNSAAFPWRALLTDISLWGNSITQFLTNVGWLFLVSWLPLYLQKVHDVPLETQGLMTSFPIGTGIVGMFCGGRLTDWAVRRLGLKWGRRILLVGSRFTAAAGYGICLLLSFLFEPSPDKAWLPWMYVAGLCLVSASADFGTPSIWAYCQDVGGKYTASILGWGNMWGNLGAAAAPNFYHWCLGENPALRNWNSLFILGGGAFFISGLSAILLDATKPLTIERS